MMKRKKLWITLTVICLVIAAFGLIFGLAFRLKTVNVEFLSREDPTRLEQGIAEKVKSDGEFSYGKNILFLNTEDNLAKIEKYNPYVKVEKAVRVFPNILTIYISERVPAYRIQNTDNELEWFIVDREFKVLDKVSSEDVSQSEYFSLTIEVTPATYTASGCQIGDFLAVTNGYDALLNNISDGIEERTQYSASAYSISVERDSEGELRFEVTMRNSAVASGKGCKLIIVGEEDLVEKVFKGVAVFEQETQGHAELNDNQNTIIVETINGKVVGRFVPGQG